MMECIREPPAGKVRPREKIQGVSGPEMPQLVCSHIHLLAEIQLFFFRKTLKKQFAMCMCPRKKKKVLIKCHIKIKSEVCCPSLPHVSVIWILSCVRVGMLTNRRLARRVTDTAGCQSCTFTL